MSAEEIQGRIDKLSADIFRQKEVLKQLEASKGAAQRQLNAILDPVARLPLEISSEIFVQCLPARPGPDASEAPLLFLNICNTWTEIALSTPALWAAIHADNPVVDPASLLNAWLKRAGSRALSISLPKNLTRDVPAVIGTHRDRLGDLTMYHDTNNIPLLAAAGPFVFLKTLTITGLALDEYEATLQLTSTTLDILRASPNLVECTFDLVVYTGDDYTDGELLVLPHMKHLKFGTYPHSYSTELILNYLSTPLLQTLHVPSDAQGQEALIRFLKRSSPPLQNIVMGSYMAVVDFSGNEMEEWLSLLPELTHLEIYHPSKLTADHIITILADSPGVVPKLSSLTLGRVPSDALWYQKLATTLSVRRKQIKFVRISDSARPAEEICVSLRQLAAEGMSIHIGTGEHNYI
ncbi:hypothetical protein DFH09DRAFT_991011 [Mycena vulgaris]|nr:hypothetical protein DFH09DRAFT_991011 [Mycena vulgaris]